MFCDGFFSILFYPFSRSVTTNAKIMYNTNLFKQLFQIKLNVRTLELIKWLIRSFQHRVIEVTFAI